MNMNTFMDSIDLMSRAMDVQTLRHEVTANNIANSEVPNYKKQYVNFESELKRAFDSKAREHESFRMVTTDERHIQSSVPKDWRSVQPRRVTEWATSADSQGNNVDAEEEAMNLVKIEMQYELLAQMQSFEFSQLDIAMKSIR